MQEHPLIELYINISDEQQNAQVEQLFSTLDLDGFVQRTLQTVDIFDPVMVTLLITDDEGIRDMNKQYRDQNKPTDVLSFPLIDQPLVQAPEEQLWFSKASEHNDAFISPPGPVLNLGDVVISWPTLLRQASEVGHSPQYELLYLLCHGVLHLVGYDDQTEAGYRAMVSIQERVLESIGQKA
jgi:probable rRNA maturation factor